MADHDCEFKRLAQDAAEMLRAVEAERDQWRDRAALVEQQGRETAADRDILQRMHHGQAEYLRADAIKIAGLEARLAAVLALCDEPNMYVGNRHLRVEEVRAALTGGAETPPAEDWATRTNRESLAAVTQMMADAQREHAAAWAEQNRPNLGPVAESYGEDG